jgi:hypothetical protein
MASLDAQWSVTGCKGLQLLSTPFEAIAAVRASQLIVVFLILRLI